MVGRLFTHTLKYACVILIHKNVKKKALSPEGGTLEMMKACGIQRLGPSNSAQEKEIHLCHEDKRFFGVCYNSNVRIRVKEKTSKELMINRQRYK